MTCARALLVLSILAAWTLPLAAQDIAWGRYAGGTLGRTGGSDADRAFHGDIVAGLFAGTRVPLGGGAFWSGEIEASRFRHDMGGGTALTGSLRLKGGIGLRDGDWSGWIAAGPAIGLADGAAEPGWVAGLGIGHALSDDVRMGAELLRQAYPGAGDAARATSVVLRLAVTF